MSVEPESNSPALVIESAAGSVIPASRPLTFAEDISFGAHGQQPAESKNVMTQVQKMAEKLDLPLTPELLQLGDNAAISSALVDMAVAAGRSQKEIDAAMNSLSK